MATLVQGFVKLLVGSGTTTVTFKSIPGVTNLNGGGASENRIDATDFDTTPGTREYINGPREPSPFTADLHYQQGDTEQEALFTAHANNTELPFKVAFGTGAQAKQITFRAVPNLTLSAQVDGKTMYALSLSPVAMPTREALSAGA
ncbi:phage tail tube protein [Brevundimonas nasdae]|uniref:phage tail tube protein n=1 Tax=Brevundimonas nasdae TaxID=172043 RepID=UPI002899B9E7|nr:phage tail tube protein [Brevundimonas nasdae]